MLDTHMETGTGKTFTFINTIYELHKKYGLAHFVVIVPSIAIKEGIKNLSKPPQPILNACTSSVLRSMN